MIQMCNYFRLDAVEFEALRGAGALLFGVALDFLLFRASSTLTVFLSIISSSRASIWTTFNSFQCSSAAESVNCKTVLQHTSRISLLKQAPAADQLLQITQPPNNAQCTVFLSWHNIEYFPEKKDRSEHRSEQRQEWQERQHERVSEQAREANNTRKHRKSGRYERAGIAHRASPEGSCCHSDRAAR